MPSPALAYVLAGTALGAALFVWQGDSYWSYSEGVYAETAREFLHGASIYRHVAVAQPPLVIVSGSAILAISDSIWALRAVLGVVDLITGALVAVSVWRVSRNAAASVLAGLLALVTPWMLHEHGHLLPETFAAPLLLGAALLASRPRASAAAGGLAALAIFFKLAFVLPVAALAAVAARRGAYAGAAVGASAALGALFFALYGGAFFDNVVTAQLQTGTRSLHDVAAYYAQSAWNIGPLCLLAALAVAFRARAADPPLLRALLALFVATLVLVGSVAKLGSDLNVIAVAEPAGVALGTAGLLWLYLWLFKTPAMPRRRLGPALAGGAAACLALLALESGSLLVSPDDPRPFIRPFSRTAHERKLSSGELRALVDKARRCPRGTAYSGDPYVAFVAKRAMPGDQPDQFIISHAETHAGLLRAAAGAARCP
jgi:hypothetical protein